MTTSAKKRKPRALGVYYFVGLALVFYALLFLESFVPSVVGNPADFAAYYNTVFAVAIALSVAGYAEFRLHSLHLKFDALIEEIRELRKQLTGKESSN